MGDFFKRYFLHCSWQCLEALKAEHPEVSVHALLVSQTIPALELVDHHPHIDKVITPKIHPRVVRKLGADKFVGDHVMLSNRMAKQFELRQPPVYLSEEDKEFVDSISTGKKFITLHPFAGDRFGVHTRTPLKPNRYIPIIKALTETGHNVVLLGSKWSRLNEKHTWTIDEVFNWRINGLINLIDKTNVRTAAELVKRSAGFVGTASSLMCAAWSLGNKRSVVLTSARWKEPLETMVWAKDRCKEPQNKIIYIPPKRTPRIHDNIARETADWFR
jgi:ADP-heptose:LPS heptosyltransferase